MFGADEKHPEEPPAYTDSGSSTSAALSDTSHGVTLTVNTSPSGSFIPGSNLDATLSIPPDVLSGIVGNVECRLEGKSSVEIMGKPRYQKAQLLNAGMGGSAMPITGREEHLFALSTQSATPESQMNIKVRIPDKRTCDCSHNSNVDFNRETGEEESGIMPSLGMDGNLGGNRVTWKLKVEIKRKGVLKRNIKLSIEIPISLPTPPASKSPLITNASKAVLDNTNLEGTLMIFPSPSSPTSQPQRIPFRLSLLNLRNPDPTGIKVSVGLCKHTWTKGVETSLGAPEGHDFAGIIVGSLTLGSPRHGPGSIGLRNDEKEWVVEGEYEVGEGMRTVRGCGLRVGWSIQAQIRWKELSAPMVLSQPLQLPHCTAY